MSRLSPKKRAEFLASLAEGNTVKGSAGLIGLTPQALQKARHREPDFAEAWEESLDHGTQTLEQEAKRRALEGWDEPVYQGGKMVGLVRKHSDTLLIFLLKARRPTVYREQVKHDVDLHQPDGPTLIEVIYTDAPTRLPSATTFSPGAN